MVEEWQTVNTVFAVQIAQYLSEILQLISGQCKHINIASSFLVSPLLAFLYMHMQIKLAVETVNKLDCKHA